MAIFTANITSALTALSLQLEPSSLAGLKVGLCTCNYVNSQSNFRFVVFLCAQKR